MSNENRFKDGEGSGARAFAVPGVLEESFSTDELRVEDQDHRVDGSMDMDGEEGRALTGSSGRRSVCCSGIFNFCRKQCAVVVLATCCVALGVALFLSTNQSGLNWKDDPLARSQRYEAVLPVLAAVTDRHVLEDPGTPQHRALVWISMEDERRVDPEKDPEHLIQRYAVASLFFATGGEVSWKKDYGFLAYEHECSWNADAPQNDRSQDRDKGVFCKGSDPHTISEITLREF